MHLEAGAARGDKLAQAELDGPALPEALTYLWELYFEIAAARGGNGFGMNPVGWHDLDAWQRVTGTRLTPFERGTLLEIDRLYLVDAAEEMKRRRAEKEAKREKR